MKPIILSRNLLALACACLALAACQTNQSGATNAPSSQSGGRLIVHRQADLGVDLLLSIDGKKAGVVRVADTYNGSLTAGQHVISIMPVPNLADQAASTATLMVETGKTYSFIAVRKGTPIVLVKE